MAAPAASTTTIPVDPIVYGAQNAHTEELLTMLRYEMANGILEGDIQRVQDLLDSGAEVNGINNNRETPLFCLMKNSTSLCRSSLENAKALISLLVERGATMNVKNASEKLLIEQAIDTLAGTQSRIPVPEHFLQIMLFMVSLDPDGIREYFMNNSQEHPSEGLAFLAPSTLTYTPLLLEYIETSKRLVTVSRVATLCLGTLPMLGGQVNNTPIGRAFSREDGDRNVMRIIAELLGAIPPGEES